MQLGRSALLVGLVSIVVLSPASAQTTSALETAVVDLDGISTRYHVAGLDKRAPGTPVIVFLSGSFAPLEVWRDVLGRLDDTIPRLTFDRPGAGQSTPVDGVLTPERVTAHLAALLERLNIAPPFVLVSWSWGGPLALDFASRHPGTVVGNVFLDPTVTGVGRSAYRARLIQLGAAAAAADSMMHRQKREGQGMLARLPPGMRSELEAITAIADEFNPPYPRVPTTILLAGRMMPGFTQGTLPAGVDEAAFFRAERAESLETLRARLREVPATVLRVLPQSAHNVPNEDPEAVVQEILRVLGLRGR
ncbi:MAG: alpha/beta fold hydrolase [Gemmatimonadaceae bacterium]